jgi:type II restriction enzyme
MSRNFNDWFATFQNTNRTFSYWVDFEKILNNADSFKVELNILNSLIGSANIENDFVNLVIKYPETLQCIPLLIAVRGLEIEQMEGIFDFSENFAKINFRREQVKYVEFVRKTGLFALIEKRKIKNLYDYVVGIEVGLDTNARKNRGGELMSTIVCNYFDKQKIKYEKEITTQYLEQRFDLDLSPITNNGKASKRFDFVIENKGIIYGIEVNFYSSGGSKLNETARSYKEIALAAKQIKNFKFVWITDGAGWKAARRNLQETFDVLPEMFNIKDLKDGQILNLLRR